MKRALRALIGVALLLAGYQGVWIAIRAYTTGLIEAAVGRPLPALVLHDLDGETIDLAALRGRTVVLHFFRSACPACLAERDGLRRLERELDPQRTVLLGVMVDRVQGFSAGATERTLAYFGFRHPIVMADAALVDAFHGVGWSRITPVTYVAGPSGTIVAAFRPPYRLDAVRAAIP